MTNNHSAFKQRTNKTKPVLAGVMAVALTLGAAGAYSAWQETQEFTAEAEAKTLGMEYSIDGGTTWHAFGGSVALPEIAEVDPETADKFYPIEFRNTGSHDVRMTDLEAVASGTLFEGDNPATISWAHPLDGGQISAYGGPSSSSVSHSMTEIDGGWLLSPLYTAPITARLVVQFDDLMDESYSGSTASIVITATTEQQKVNWDGEKQ